MKNVFWSTPDAAWLRHRTAGMSAWLWVWWPAVVACVVILVESTATMSAANTSSWLRPWFERVLGRMTDASWGELHHILRKSGHFLGYGIVCVTFMRGWLRQWARQKSWTLQRWRANAYFAAIGCTALVASLDEWHQTMLPGRTGMASDAVLDTLGGVVICGVLWGICWGRGGLAFDSRKRS